MTTRPAMPEEVKVHAPFSHIFLKSRRLELILLFLILILALAVRLWGLEQNGWGAEYYSAAVRSMAINWHNFFYLAFDPVGFISIDKPPGALWPQVASVKLFGFHPLSLLMPQVLEGVASVGLLYHLVRRRFSAMSALLAALFFAITPIWVAVNRTNNTDSCLLLVLLLAAWALIKASEEGSRSLLLLSMALVGLAFNVKMLAAFILLPAFFMTYFLGVNHRWQRRLFDLALATLFLTAYSLPWVLTVEFTPTEQRPYVGGSRQNSMLDLIVGHNALSRFRSINKSPSTGAGSGADPQSERKVSRSTAGRVAEPDRSKSIAVSRLFVRSPPGPLRLMSGQLAAQTAWLLPLALMGLIIGGLKDRSLDPLDPGRLTLLFWLCWIIIYGVVYSSLGGIFHFYYLSTLAPALAALAGIGTASLWSIYRQRHSSALLLPISLLVTSAWQIYIQAGALGWTFEAPTAQLGNWQHRLCIVIAGGTLLSAIGLLIAFIRGATDRAIHFLAESSLALGVGALLTLPFAWTLSSVLIPVNGILPSADLYRLISAYNDDETLSRGISVRYEEIEQLTSFLKANRRDERYLLVSSSSHLAAPIIIRTGEAVMARGGYSGMDPAVNPEILARMLIDKQIRFVMLGDVSLSSRIMGANVAGKPVNDWVREKGKIVDPRLWRSARSRSKMELYDLRPEITLAPVLSSLYRP